MTDWLPVDLLEALADAHGRVVDVAVLEGGLGNYSFRVRTADGSDLAVRLPGRRSTRADREAEKRHTAAAAEVGVAPKVDQWISTRGALVTEFVTGAALLPVDLKNRDVLTRVASQLRRLHRARGFVGGFDLAVSRREYVAEAAAAGVQVPSWVGDLAPTVEAVEVGLLADEPRVASHNDLVPANIIDDGSRCWFIDFEYSAPNVASFDLGTLVAAGGLAPEETDQLVSTYWGERSALRTARARAWSLIQRFSYLAWARLQPAEATRHDPSYWAEGGPNGLADLRSALEGWASGQFGGGS